MGRDPSLSWLLPAGVAIITAAAAYLLGQHPAEGRPLIKKHKKAFLLVIKQEYKSLRDRDEFIRLFEPLAKYVTEHEKTTLAYELSISDKDPHKVIIFERYIDKAGLVDIHQKSEPFIKFKQACRDANLEVTTDGESYIETDMGIM